MPVIQEMLLKSIDQEIELILIKQKQYNLDSFARGYHAYKDHGGMMEKEIHLFFLSDISIYLS